MTIDIQHEAELILDTVRYESATFADWDAIFDYCDIQTGGAVDYFQLELIVDYVARRLRVAIA